MRWIGWQASNGEDAYMTDGGYIQVCSAVFPGKVSWGSDDHSAVTTATSGRWVSKWGPQVYVQHDWNDTPYDGSNLKYFSATTVQGSNYVSTSDMTFSVGPGATYSWSYSGPLQVVGSSNQKDFTVRCNGTGAGWVEVSITSSCDSRTITSRKNIQIGAPNVQTMRLDGNVIQPYPPNNVCVNTSYNLNADILGSGSSTWQILNNSSGGSVSYSSFNTATISSGSNQGNFVVKLTVFNSCGSLDYWYPFIVNSCGYRMYTVSPNPTKDELNVEFEASEEGKDFRKQLNFSLKAPYPLPVRA